MPVFPVLKGAVGALKHRENRHKTTHTRLGQAMHTITTQGRLGQTVHTITTCGRLGQAVHPKTTCIPRSAMQGQSTQNNLHTSLRPAGQEQATIRLGSGRFLSSLGFGQAYHNKLHTSSRPAGLEHPKTNCIPLLGQVLVVFYGHQVSVRHTITTCIPRSAPQGQSTQNNLHTSSRPAGLEHTT